MWTWFNCYLSGRHDYGMWCEPGTIYLRCVHCGRRSSGWAVNQKLEAQRQPTVSHTHRPVLIDSTKAAPVSAARVIPFTRTATS
jgi:hypothetical protein